VGARGSRMGNARCKQQRSHLEAKWTSSHKVLAQIGLSELTGGAYALLDIRDTHGCSG